MQYRFEALALTLVALTASAGAPTIPLGVSINGDGTVTSDPTGISCPSDCTDSFRKNVAVTLTAVAHGSNTFLGWEGACVGTQPTCQLILRSAVTVIANFDTTVPTYPAPATKTGQTACYDTAYPQASELPIDCTGTRQDGEYQMGVAWPAPRFEDTGNGTVKDLLTGIVWLRDGACYPAMRLREAFTEVAALADGACGLTDGSHAGDWRLANARQLSTLIDYRRVGPVLPEGHPFSIAIDWYWTSTAAVQEDNIRSVGRWVFSSGDGQMRVHGTGSLARIMAIRVIQ